MNNSSILFGINVFVVLLFFFQSLPKTVPAEDTHRHRPAAAAANSSSPIRTAAADCPLSPSVSARTRRPRPRTPVPAVPAGRRTIRSPRPAWRPIIWPRPRPRLPIAAAAAVRRTPRRSSGPRPSLRTAVTRTPTEP